MNDAVLLGAEMALQGSEKSAWVKPEVSQLDLETAQQTGIPGTCGPDCF